MKKLFGIAALIILALCFIALILSLAINSPESPFRMYRSIIGIGSLAIGGIIVIIFARLIK